MFTTLKKVIFESHEELKNLSPKELVEKRMEKYSSMGVFKG
jgi:acetyl-CoA carboxylase carboxyl transferase subunit alpha